MRRLLAIILIAAALGGCKTSEANYRAAYEKAVAGRDSSDAIENTIYGAKRRDMDSRMIIAGGDSVEARVQRVAVTEGGGGISEYLHAYNVVVGQFKQRFNAVSMRDRLAGSGYPRAFVVQNGEPYYYVVLSSHDTQAEAVKALKSIPTGFPVAMKAPLPYILCRP